MNGQCIWQGAWVRQRGGGERPGGGSGVSAWLCPGLHDCGHQIHSLGVVMEEMGSSVKATSPLAS